MPTEHNGGVSWSSVLWTTSTSTCIIDHKVNDIPLLDKPLHHINAFT